MSLYHEASQVLESIRKHGGSIKSHVFSKKSWKSDPKTLFALTTEASKWSDILTEVIEKSGILKTEKQVPPRHTTHSSILQRLLVSTNTW